MLSEELKTIVSEIRKRKCEAQNIEIKQTGKGTPSKLYDTMSGFANQTGGGIIVFGIDESNDYEVTGVYDVQDLQVRVTNAALQMQPVLRPVFTVCDYEGKTVVSAEIPECDAEDKPCFYRAAGRICGSYVRVGDADLPMTEYEVYAYEAYRKKVRDELRTNDRATAQDFSRNLVQGYLLRLHEAKPVLAAKSEETILRLQGLTENNFPTVAGLLLLCDYPQAFYPQLGITAMVVDGTEIGKTGTRQERFIDNRRIEGPIPVMLEEALAFVRRNIRTAVLIDDNGHRQDRPEYPLIAVREAILNSLIHRDYSRYTEDSPIRLILYRDRLVVENPGGLYGRLTVSDLGKMPGDTRNPFIAGNLEVMIRTENRFSGIPSILEEMEAAGLPAPVFESSRGMFRVTLYNSAAVQDSVDPPDRDREAEILDFCRVPRSKAEITAHIGISTAYYLVKRYLRPMTETGKLKMTIPDKPGSKNQRFVTVLKN